MSSGEARAWAALRRLREHGVHVVRQHEIGRYTVDFAIRKARIAIEIDGAVHDLPGRADYDAQRQAHTPSMAGGAASPHPPTPSPQGEGEFAAHLRRRTRANRKLPPRRKP